MTSEFKPLIYDKSQPKYLREMVMEARLREGPEYNLRAGLARHRALVASGAPMPDWMNQSAGNAFTGSELFTRIVGIAAIPMAITGAIWGIWMFSSPPTNAKRGFDPNVTVRGTPITVQSDTAKVADAPAKTPKPRPANIKETVSVGASEASLPADDTAATTPKKKTAVTRTQVKESSSVASRKSDNTAQPAPTNSNAANTTAAQGNYSVAVQPRVAAGVVASAQTQPALPSQSESILQREIALLAQARRYATTRPTDALALVHNQEIKTGLLNEEWDQVNLLSLLKLGRSDDVQQAAQLFRVRYPNSAFNERIRKALSSNSQ